MLLLVLYYSLANLVEGFIYHYRKNTNKDNCLVYRVTNEGSTGPLVPAGSSLRQKVDKKIQYQILKTAANDSDEDTEDDFLEDETSEDEYSEDE